jgi:microcystin degradation protein MlrC
MRELQARALSLVQPPLLDVSVYGGFAYANSSNIGASVMAWAYGSPEAAQQAVDAVYADLARLQQAFEIELIGAAEGITRALATPGLVAVPDAADNPLSGGIGDTPGLLRAVLDAGIGAPVVLASFADEAIVARARAAGVGRALQVALGGQRTAAYGAPVAIEMHIERLTDGVFVNTGPMERGARVDCGPSVVLRSGDLRVIVTAHVAPCNDPGFFDLHGIDLASTRLLAVKAKNHFRGAFAERCAAIVDVDLPGPATLDLRRLPLARPRPVPL